MKSSQKIFITAQLDMQVISIS